MEDPRNLVLEIKRKIAGIGPGFLVTVQSTPGEWQALLDAIASPGEASFRQVSRWRWRWPD